MNLKKISNASADTSNSYALEMSAYYRQLKREQKSGKRAKELDYLSDLLDRCSALPSPQREQLFLDSVLARDTVTHARAA